VPKINNAYKIKYNKEKHHPVQTFRFGIQRFKSKQKPFFFSCFKPPPNLNFDVKDQPFNRNILAAKDSYLYLSKYTKLNLTKLLVNRS
jgi:hypothetical protein